MARLWITVFVLVLVALVLAVPIQKHRKKESPLKISQILSPNCDERPPHVEVDTIVLHHTTIETLEETAAWFQDPARRVSAHFVIGRDGEIVQMVDPRMRAWHAGKSLDGFGRHQVNDFSIGIELVNNGLGQDYPEHQLKSLDRLLRKLTRAFKIKAIVSHEYIAEPAGRKDDPRGFPWDRMKAMGVPLFYGAKPSSS